MTDQSVTDTKLPTNPIRERHVRVNADQPEGGICDYVSEDSKKRAMSQLDEVTGG